ncbi:MAG: efflux RND transporter periplasmic adaptor subunit [Gemmatimonadales bacterium]
MTNPMRRGTVAALFLALASAACHRGVQTPPPPEATATDSSVTVTAAQRGQIATEPVARHTFNPSVYTTGTVNFDGDKSTQVIPAISGPVLRLLVNLGDSVHPGEALALVSSPDFATDVSGMRKADAAWHNAQRIETLDEKLFANDALARTDLDQAKSDLSAAIADRDAAIQQLYALGVDSASVEALRDGKEAAGGQSAVRAPIGGVIVERLITPGQLLQAGATPAFTIADLSTMWVLANVFDGDIGEVQKGGTALITTDVSPDTLVGRIDYVAAVVDPESKAAAVRVVVPDRGGVLRQNMLVRLEIRGTAPKTAITIPVGAVLRDDEDLPFVYLDAGNNHFLRRRITLGVRSGENYEVDGGLAAGDELVVRGALYLDEVASQ